MENNEEAETESETEEFTEAETETEEISETESEIETEIEEEIEEQEISLMSLAGGDGTEDSVDLKKYVTSVVFQWRDQDGNPWVIKQNEDGVYEFPVGCPLSFNLEYKIPAGIVTKEKNVMTYTLPPVFSYANQSGDITWGDQIVGKYTIDGCNVTLTLDPNSSFLDQASA